MQTIEQRIDELKKDIADSSAELRRLQAIISRGIVVREFRLPNGEQAWCTDDPGFCPNRVDLGVILHGTHNTPRSSSMELPLIRSCALYYEGYIAHVDGQPIEGRVYSACPVNVTLGWREYDEDRAPTLISALRATTRAILAEAKESRP